MGKIIQYRWFVLFSVIVLTVGMFVISPDLTEQAEEAGNFQLADDADSQRAAQMLEEADASPDTISVVFALENPLNDESRDTIQTVVDDLQDYGAPVVEVMKPLENEQAENQFVSEDEQTVLLPVTVEGTEQEINAFADTVKSETLPEEMETYMTGEALINHDVNISAQEGLERTEIITVIIIFGLLLAVFRSVVTPLVPLVAVGLTYLLSQSIVAFLIEWFGFPVSNYTQIFLVAVLFGIGTDYCILLLNRYKEELTLGKGVEEAVIETYRTAGKTLAASAVSGFIAFFVIIFADFPIYKSAAGVAIGVIILLFILFTVLPFFMVVLKDKLFWPSKKAATHNESKLWKGFSFLSVVRPVRSILLVAVIIVPLLLLYEDDLSFNMTDEIGSGYESVEGLERIEEAFGEGDALPVQVVMQQDQDIATAEAIPHLENITSQIEGVEGVDGVRTITRPGGDLLEGITVEEHYETIEENIPELNDGIEQLAQGIAELEEGSLSLQQQAPEQVSSQLETSAGNIAEIEEELSAISASLEEAEQVPEALNDLEILVSELETVEEDLVEINEELQPLGDPVAPLIQGIEEIQTGVGDSASGLQDIVDEFSEAGELVESIQNSETAAETNIYLPEEIFEEEDFNSVLDQFTFANGEGMTMEVILSVDPYSVEAMEILEEVKETVESTGFTGKLTGIDVAYSGVPSINSDLDEISSDDYVKTTTIMLSALFVILVVLLRSLLMPLYMIGSLLFTYYASVSVAEIVFVNMLGYDGISWAVPFFGYVMLVALGVDYSIFLLTRYQEEVKKGVGYKEAMSIAMAKMGSVIITAAIILAGTFAAMIPSGVLSLMQIATIVITGLLLYGLIVLPLFISAVTVLLGKYAWFPFWKNK
ncbi:MMPL family transporter [Halalkalibacillus halophilus]|uniref:MMPL family transporter n=1 Tax=Halalkalibacillus halophilus TaxID=392827 RepID=UPI000402C0F4|nr:MMPL family transporter [Halalkalibacillus halophilus]